MEGGTKRAGRCETIGVLAARVVEEARRAATGLWDRDSDAPGVRRRSNGRVSGGGDVKASLVGTKPQIAGGAMGEGHQCLTNSTGPGIVQHSPQVPQQSVLPVCAGQST